MRQFLAGMVLALALVWAHQQGTAVAANKARYRCKKASTDYDLESWVNNAEGSVAFVVDKVICFKS
jgi:hypothetical protein